MEQELIALVVAVSTIVGITIGMFAARVVQRIMDR